MSSTGVFYWPSCIKDIDNPIDQQVILCCPMLTPWFIVLSWMYVLYHVGVLSAIVWCKTALSYCFYCFGICASSSFIVRCMHFHYIYHNTHEHHNLLTSRMNYYAVMNVLQMWPGYLTAGIHIPWTTFWKKFRVAVYVWSTALLSVHSWENCKMLYSCLQCHKIIFA